VALDYDSGLIESAPDEVIEQFCGVGNPFSLGEIKPGGRLQFADMALKEALPPEEMTARAWSE